jgi:hypothetical protein
MSGAPSGYRARTTECSLLILDLQNPYRYSTHPRTAAS